RIVENCPRHQLRLAGSSSLPLDYWKRAADGSGVGRNVSFLGFVDQVTLASNFRESRIFVLASWSEGFGLVALEAASTGAKVVMPEYGAADSLLRQYLDENQLFLYPRLKSEALNDRRTFAEGLSEAWRAALRSSETVGSSVLPQKFGLKSVAMEM